MRYHHQLGAMKERKGIGKGKIIVFVLIILPVLGYAGFLAALPSVGGWPLKDSQEVVQKIRSVQPGTEGNRLFIPRLNVELDLDSREAQREGEFGVGRVGSISAPRFTFGVTPDHILSASPFYRLDQLTSGDEFYVDYDGTRYAYRISDETTEESRLVLQASDESVSINAEPIGVVAWNNGQPRIEVESEVEGIIGSPEDSFEDIDQATSEDL